MSEVAHVRQQTCALETILDANEGRTHVSWTQLEHQHEQHHLPTNTMTSDTPHYDSRAGSTSTVTSTK